MGKTDFWTLTDNNDRRSSKGIKFATDYIRSTGSGIAGSETIYEPCAQAVPEPVEGPQC